VWPIGNMPLLVLFKYAVNRTLAANGNGQRRRSATCQSGESSPHSKLRQRLNGLKTRFNRLHSAPKVVGKGEGASPWNKTIIRSYMPRARGRG